MTAALTHTVRVVCSWCRAEWRKPWDSADDGVSHSICESCLDVKFPNVSAFARANEEGV